MVMSVLVAMLGLAALACAVAVVVLIVTDGCNDRYEHIGQCVNDETMLVLDKRTGMVKIALYRLPEEETPNA